MAELQLCLNPIRNTRDEVVCRCNRGLGHHGECNWSAEREDAPGGALNGVSPYLALEREIHGEPRCLAWADGRHAFVMRTDVLPEDARFKLCACGARVERTKGGG